ncbi:amino acid aminotransferase [Glaciimonas sp. PCH181]|uniref:amino acid aminotransferase n=1 Tax=Glaciimonas sp. PCH181 TaxID=2133943 RepID=UPI000D3B6D61|nr:amino acid aminotransferase [Glaciimonas sp. PCH181]PUA18929.1 aromatic amino acid aminotransferase [Glaciimonas sp. PCH181]
MFEHVDAYPGDPILTLNEEFSADPRPEKINLSIGVYLNAAGQLPLMGPVLKAEQSILQHPAKRAYLPMEGLVDYRNAVRNLLFGDADPAMKEKRIATVQTLGGSGALKVGADFLAAYFPDAQVWVSDPTWDNHHAIFAGAGIAVNSYPYYNAATQHVDFDAMQTALKAIPPGSIVLLHACCHNPTGADLNPQQWRDLATTIQGRSLLPFFDIAYQGFGQGIEDDAFAIRYFASLGIQMLVAGSFSKNFSLYGERCGALHALCNDETQANNVLGQLKAAVRRNYSSPPTHGARIIATVLGSHELRSEWQAELEAMRIRVQSMRDGLYTRLQAELPAEKVDYLRKQTGMFSFTGLNPAQVRRLRDEFAIYLVGSGRICLAALTQEKIAPVAAAMMQVMD